MSEHEHPAQMSEAPQPTLGSIELMHSVVLANGTTRLQLDLMLTSGLSFHTMFSSQLLGYTKVRWGLRWDCRECLPKQPDPRVYERALQILQRSPDEVAMVAAHAYDLRAARKV